MRQRFNLDDSGRFVDREGNVLGRITSITLDLAVGVKGVKDVLPLTASTEISSNVELDLNVDGGSGETDDAAPPNADPVEIVWSRYQEVIPNGSRYQLDAKKRRIIQLALAVPPPKGETSLARCLRAVEGLAVSPHHRGQNDRRKVYLGIRYALQGIGNESTDERIQKMIEIGERNGAAAKMAGSRANCDPSVMSISAYLETIPSGVRETVATHVENVCRMRQSPDHRILQRNGAHSEAMLAKTWRVAVVTSVEADDRVKLEGVVAVEEDQER